jgi:hypothetical protein
MASFQNLNDDDKVSICTPTLTELLLYSPERIELCSTLAFAVGSNA